MSDQQIDNTRRQLYALVSLSHDRIDRAAALLAHRAAAAPKSAEADAHALLVMTRQDIERWLCKAGELVGIQYIADRGLLNAETEKTAVGGSPRA